MRSQIIQVTNVADILDFKTLEPTVSEVYDGQTYTESKNGTGLIRFNPDAISSDEAKTILVNAIINFSEQEIIAINDSINRLRTLLQVIAH